MRKGEPEGLWGMFTLPLLYSAAAVLSSDFSLYLRGLRVSVKLFDIDLKEGIV
jgi:hypothetical protein